MLEYYVQIKLVHVGAALLSGSLFLLRGLLVLSDERNGARVAPLRYLSYAVDTVLLTAALMLVSVLPRAMFANGWLAAKLTLLVPYVVLGSFALKRARSARVRWITYGLALVAFALMLGIARTHDPLGPLRGW
ncbi:MAG: SirB2 family protein [Panacagrimonas sp.]